MKIKEIKNIEVLNQKRLAPKIQFLLLKPGILFRSASKRNDGDHNLSGEKNHPDVHDYTEARLSPRPGAT
jgi:hypothetical protein